MAGTGTVEDNKAFVTAVIALEAQIKNLEDAAFAAEYFFDVFLCIEKGPKSSSTSNSPSSHSSTRFDVPEPITRHQQTDAYKPAQQQGGYGQGRSSYIPPHLRGARGGPAPSWAANPSPASIQSASPPQSAKEFHSDPKAHCAFKRTPTLDEPLPCRLRALVDDYKIATLSVLVKLIEHGGVDFAFYEVSCGEQETVGRVESLIYKDRKNMDQIMMVGRKRVEGTCVDVPYVSADNYMDLYHSMIARKELCPNAMSHALNEMSGQLDIAIAARSTVHEWHKLLPVADARVKDNDSHGHFLGILKHLREAISRQVQQSR